MVSIVRAEMDDLEQCTDILFDSEIGQIYYPRRKWLLAEVTKGLSADRIYVKKHMNEERDCRTEIAGVIWYQLESMFHTFPYLHMVAVKKEYRGKGFFTELMDFFEQDVLLSGRNRMRTKVFLTVADFNDKAQALYLRRGYRRLGEIEGLFRDDVTERLMMKVVTPTTQNNAERAQKCSLQII